MDEQLWRLVDRTAVIERIVRFANSFDAKDWGVLRSCLVENIATDYSQFRGEPPRRMAADEYVASRRQTLAGLRTLHISTNHDVRITGDNAVCWSAYRIYRLDPTREAGENSLDTAGNYEHGLLRTDRGWKISRIRQTVVMQRGNPRIHGALRPDDR
jgi:hypothetical protein